MKGDASIASDPFAQTHDLGGNRFYLFARGFFWGLVQ